MALIWATGCGDDAGPIDAAGGSLTVELGTGTVEFEPLADGQDLLLVSGPQGGNHFIVHARASGLVAGDPARPGAIGNPSTTFADFDENGSQLDAQFPPYRLGFREGADAWFELPSGRILQMAPEVDVPSVYGQRVRITVTITDVTGASGSDERWVVALKPVELDGGVSDAGVVDAN